jgi:hypothetical protein
MGGIAHALWFLVSYRILSSFDRGRGFALAGAAVAVLVSATAFTVWNQSNVNEKVYTVTLATIALLSWLAFHWRDHAGEGKDDNVLVLMAFILALSVGNHLMAFLAAPALAVFVVFVRPQTLVNWKLYPAVLAAAVLGLSIHLALPLRAGLDPVINEADPTCPSIGSALASVVTYGQTGCEELSLALTRDQYQKDPVTMRQAPFGAQYLNYFQYFDWQWARGLDGTNTVFARARLPFTLLFATLGLFGALTHYREDRPSFWYIAILFGTLSVALVYYLNFKYGYSLADPFGDYTLHEVRERDYFFIVGFSVWGLWSGIGIAALWRAMADSGERSLRSLSPILALGMIPLVLNFGWASRAGDYTARDWGYDLLQSVPPYGILFTNGDNDTFPLWYLQEVEGIRRDVTVVVTSYLNTAWYAKQIRDLTTPCPPGVDPLADATRITCQRPYDPSGTPVAYSADPGSLPSGIVPIPLTTAIQLPSSSAIPLTDEEIEAVAETGYQQLAAPQSYVFGDVVATVDPRFLTDGVMYPWHALALFMIRESLGQRPIHFATSGTAAQALGLDDYLYRHGHSFGLNPTSLVRELPEGIVEIVPWALSPVTGEWIDFDRTRILLDEVFIHRGGVPDEWDHWPDASTVGIPNYYAWAYYALTRGAEGMEEYASEIPRWEARGDVWTVLGNSR